MFRAVVEQNGWPVSHDFTTEEEAIKAVKFVISWGTAKSGKVFDEDDHLIFNSEKPNG